MNPNLPSHPKFKMDDSGNVWLNFGAYGGEVELARFSPCGTRILMVKEVGLAWVWDVESGEQFGEIEPNSLEFFLNRAIAYTQLRETGRARDDFDRAIVLKPNYARAFFNRGYFRYSFGDKSGALEDFAKAEELGDSEAPKWVKSFGRLINDQTQDERLNNP